MANQPTVLIVNDDPLQLRIAATILRRDGFIVLSCPSAEEALRRLSEPSAVNVIVTDLYMPGIDGWRFCRLLRSAAFAQFNRIPILVVSAIFSGADAEELTVQLGADGFLAAPYEPATLCRAVRGLLVDTKPVSSKTVLLVEPDAGLAQELTAIFAAAGYRVAQAADGAQALFRFNQEPSQIVVLDGDYAEVMPPGLIETIKRPGTATVVIVMTSVNSADLAMDLLRKGADNQMQKSAVRQELLQLCESAVRQRALLRIEELLQIRTQRLRDSEERYRGLFENAGNGIATYTLDGVIVSVNGALEALMAATRDVLAGKPYSRLMTAASFSNAKRAQEDARTDNRDSWVCALELGAVGWRRRAGRKSLPVFARQGWRAGAGDGDLSRSHDGAPARTPARRVYRHAGARYPQSGGLDLRLRRILAARAGRPGGCGHGPQVPRTYF